MKDCDSLKTFAAEKKPSSKARQYLSAMYWLKEMNGTPTVNIDSIYAFFKTAGWSVGFNDWGQPFHNLVHEDLIRKGATRSLRSTSRANGLARASLKAWCTPMARSRAEIERF